MIGGSVQSQVQGLHLVLQVYLRQPHIMPEAAPLKIQLISTVFPRPTNLRYGTWARGMAEALAVAGHDVQVVSFTPWVPRLLRFLPRAQKHADSPRIFNWGPFTAKYPRWIYYDKGPLHRWTGAHPHFRNAISWACARNFLVRETRDFKPDVNFAIGTVPNGYMARELHRLTGTPYTVADFDFGEIDDCRYSTRRAAEYRYTLERCSKWIAVSKRMQSSMRSLLPEVPSGIVYNGVKGPAEEMRRNPRPAHLAGKLVGFTACHFYTRKGLPLLVEAFAKASRDRPDAILRIAGDGEEKPALLEAIQKHGISDRIELLGPLSPEQVLQNMLWSDYFCLVGWDEPFATAYLEALSCGLPVICANDGGINDVIENGVQGITVPPKDLDATVAALRTMLHNDEERHRMAREARALFDRALNPRALADQLTEVLRAAAESRTG
jgi:glycosyltransferase involved in cell wall biosynthesis